MLWHVLTSVRVITAFICWVVALLTTMLVAFLAWETDGGVSGNVTIVEEWVVDHGDRRRRQKLEPALPFPYSRGATTNWLDVLGSRKSMWLLPTRTEGNAFWPAVSHRGCQAVFVMEQIVQKAHKKSLSTYHNVIRPFSDRWRCFCCCCFGVLWQFGCNEVLDSPLLDEPRVNTCPGDRVLVSKRSKYWLFGRIVKVDEQSSGADCPRLDRQGWFPRASVARGAGVHHKVPHQKLLQGMWDTESRRVIRVTGVIVYVWSRNPTDEAPPFALQAVERDGKTVTELQGCTLLECDGQAAHWSNGDIWIKQQTTKDSAAAGEGAAVKKGGGIKELDDWQVLNDSDISSDDEHVDGCDNACPCEAKKDK